MRAEARLDNAVVRISCAGVLIERPGEDSSSVNAGCNVQRDMAVLDQE